MRDEDIEEMVSIERTYWWHQGKRHIVRGILSRYLRKRGRILDYGCGGGDNLGVLSAFGTAEGVDTSQTVVDWCRKRDLGNVSLIQPGEVPPGPYDLITALDVVEHIRDDIGTLESFNKSLVPGGLLLVSVPAYRFLWSEHDEALLHIRRYVASEMRAKMSMTGFEVIFSSYAVTFAFPIILAFRLFRGIFPKSYERPKVSYVILPRWLNFCFFFFSKLEAAIMTRLNLPVGCSLFVVARKPGA